MKKYAVLILSIWMLAACASPDYANNGDKKSDEHIETSGTAIITLNGNVVEITEDNVIRVKVARPNEAIEKGLKVHPDGVVDISLALIEVPTLSSNGSTNIVNDLLQEMLLKENINLELIESNQAVVHLPEHDASLQEILVETGLAVVPELSEHLNLKELELSAQNREMGVWTLQEFQDLTISSKKKFANSVNIPEDDLNEIITQIESTNWSGAIKGMIENIEAFSSK